MADETKQATPTKVPVRQQVFVKSLLQQGASYAAEVYVFCAFKEEFVEFTVDLTPEEANELRGRMEHREPAIGRLDLGLAGAAP